MILQLAHISKRYDSPSGTDPVTVLDDVSLSINHGESLAVVGPSGSGKSTLLNIMGALDKPSEGQVQFDDRNLADLDENELAEIRNRDIGFVFQQHHLLPQLTVLENVLVPTLPLRTTQQEEPRARELLKRVGLESHLDHRPAQLSGGEQQRVAVVRALINSPKVLLADEPTGSLDQTSSENLATLLVELNAEQNVTLVVVTHSMPLAQKLSQVCELKQGRLSESSK